MKACIILVIALALSAAVVSGDEGDKPGSCPPFDEPNGYYLCAPLCTADSDCPGSMKCCMEGCGLKCVDPQ